MTEQPYTDIRIYRTPDGPTVAINGTYASPGDREEVDALVREIEQSVTEPQDVEDGMELAPFHVSDETYEWCPHCLKTSLARSGIYALASTGPRRIGEWAMCADCGRSPYENQEKP